MKVYVIKDSANFTHVSFNKDYMKYLNGEVIKEIEVNNYFDLDKVFDENSEELLDDAIVRIVNELIGDNK
jgi:hypothetical protein